MDSPGSSDDETEHILPPTCEKKPGEWEILVHEVFSHERGCRIYGSSTVLVSPSATVEQFLHLLRSCPEADPVAISSESLRPFAENILGRVDDNGRSFLTENPDAQPNCSWAPSPSGKTITEAGLCDGAVLFYYTERRSD